METRSHQTPEELTRKSHRRAWTLRRILGVVQPLALTVFLVMGVNFSGAAEPTIVCTVVSTTTDGVYIDAGTASGIESGASGYVERSDALIALISITAVAKNSSLARLVSNEGDDLPQTGDKVIVQTRPEEDTPPVVEEPRSLSPTLKNLNDPDSTLLQPLLTPPVKRSVGYPETSNIFHGRVWSRQTFQVDSKSQLDYSMTRIGSRGSVERLAGQPWSLLWSGDVSYRDGHAFRAHDDYQDVRVDWRSLHLQRKFEDGSFLRLGRFLPYELPSVGYLDGAHGEVALTENVSLGSMLGLKPKRDDLDFSADEPTFVSYATVEAGSSDSVHFSGTGGLLTSLFEGDPDRLAFLLDQRLAVHPKLSLHASTEVDVDIGGAETRDGVELTRLNVHAISPLTSILTVRGGVDHYQRPDTQSERDLLPFEDDALFDRGYWRYWVGSSQNLPLRLRLDEELSFTDAPTDDFTVRWRLSLSREGIFALESARVTITVYNLEGSTLEGYGGRIYATVPLLNGRLVLSPALGFRLAEVDPDDDDFDLTDLSMQADWRISPSWSTYARLSHTFGEGVQATLLDMGLVWSW